MKKPWMSARALRGCYEEVKRPIHMNWKSDY